MTRQELAAYAAFDIKKAKTEDLADIATVEIADTLILKRIEGYIKTVKNPYCFRVKQMPVKVVFSGKTDAPTIEKSLVKIGTRRMR